MGEILYFILDSGEETRFLEVPGALREPVKAYITDHTKYDISAIVDRFTERPVFVDGLHDFLFADRQEAMRGLWMKLGLYEAEAFMFEDFLRLARENEWARVFTLLLECKRRKLEMKAPYRIYTVSGETPDLSAGLPAGAEIIIDKDSIPSFEESQLGREVTVDELMYREHFTMKGLINDVAHFYTEAQSILDRLGALDSGDGG